MKRLALAIILLFPSTMVWAAAPGEQQPAADPARQALAATVQDLTQVWVSTRAQLAAAETQIQSLQEQNKACKPTPPTSENK